MSERGQEPASFDLLVNISSYTDEELRALADNLQREENDISRHRRLLHAQLDILRAEMVRRLRDKHRSGENLVDEGDVQRLSTILSSRGLIAEEATESP